VNCPRDTTILETISERDREVEMCPTCGGLWCEASELARLVGTADDLPPTENLRVDGMRTVCPACDEIMNRRFYSQLRRVMVDRCPKCLGTWLDENELSDIVKIAHDLRG